MESWPRLLQHHGQRPKERAKVFLNPEYSKCIIWCLNMLWLKLKVQTQKNKLQTLTLLSGVLTQPLRRDTSCFWANLKIYCHVYDRKWVFHMKKSNTHEKADWEWHAAWLVVAASWSQTQKEFGLNISAPLRETDKEIVAELYYRLHTNRCSINPQRREPCIWAEDVFKLHLHVWWPGLQHNTFSAALQQRNRFMCYFQLGSLTACRLNETLKPWTDVTNAVSQGPIQLIRHSDCPSFYSRWP